MAAGQNKVVYTTDAGATWEDGTISKEGTATSIDYPVPESAVISSGDDGSGGIYYSQDHGTSWQKASGPSVRGMVAMYDADNGVFVERKEGKVWYTVSGPQQWTATAWQLPEAPTNGPRLLPVGPQDYVVGWGGGWRSVGSNCDAGTRFSGLLELNVLSGPSELLNVRLPNTVLSRLLLVDGAVYFVLVAFSANTSLIYNGGYNCKFYSEPASTLEVWRGAAQVQVWRYKDAQFATRYLDVPLLFTELDVHGAFVSAPLSDKLLLNTGRFVVEVPL